MARHTDMSSAAHANRSPVAARRARDLRPSSSRVRLLCIILCCACTLLPSSPMLASGPSTDRRATVNASAAPARARQTQESPQGLPDLNEARHRPRREPRAVPPVPSTLRRCQPRRRGRCGGPSTDATPAPAPATTPTLTPSGTPAPSPSAPHGHAALSGSSGPTVASVASYSLLALASAALGGGRPVLDMSLVDFYAPGGGYAMTDAPPPALAAQAALNPPVGLQVNATSDSQVSLSWSAPAQATAYRVERATSLSGPYSAANAAAVTNASFGDTNVSHAVSYLYRVCAADGANNCVSPYSNVVMATAYTFADDPLVTNADHLNNINTNLPVTPIRLTHITQLREAVNAVRHLAGRADAAWTHPTLIQYQSVVSAADVQDLRDRLGEALSDLDVPVAAYTDQTLSTGQNGTAVKRDHIKQLRDRVRSGAVGGDGVAAGQGTGLTGQYYGDTGLSVYKLTRTDATVNFDWGTGSPDPSIATDNFSVRWAGMIVPRYSETYTFYTTTDEGVRLWVDGQLLIDHWADQAATQWSGQVAMQAGRAYAIRMEYYEHQGAASARLEWSSASQAREIVPQSQLYPCWKDAGQYVADFFQGALGRQPSTAEQQEWAGLLDQAEGGDQLVEQAQALGRTLFNSTEYAARNPDQHQYADAHQYVSDLYHGYMQRDPDQSGWDFWTQNTLSNGRASTLAAFATGAEFQEKVRRLCGTSSAATNNGGVGYDFSTAKLDPSNRTGGGGADPLSRNFNFSIPLVSLPGRSGLDLGLSLSYNSLVWTKDSTGVTFDADDGFPGPGFRLGFPTVEPKFLNPQTGQYTYMMVTPSGARVELRQVGASSNYESADSSYMQLIDGGGALTLLAADGTRLSFMLLDGEYFCYQVEDRNGNFISAAYFGDGRIDHVTDTLGRTIGFNYDSNQNLISITQAWKRETEAGAADETHVWATFGYRSPNLTLLPLFTNLAVIGDQPGETIPVLSQVGLSDGSYYTFDYNDWGQVWKVTHYAADAVGAQGQPNYSHALTYTKVNLPGSDLAGETAQSDCPRFTEEHTWVEYGVRNASAEVVTAYQPAWSPAMAECDITPPTDIDSADGLVVKEFYATSGWQKGLVTSEEFWVNGAKRKWTNYTPDHDGAPDALYPTNPRVKDSTVNDLKNDGTSNHRRTSVSYTTLAMPDGATYTLPQDVTEYAADATTPLRTTRTQYDVPNLSQYLGLHIVGLPSYRLLYEGDSSGILRSKVGYVYDDNTLANYLQALPSSATQHDIANYATSFRWRGNVNRVRRYGVNPDTGAETGATTESQVGYNVTGTVAFTADPLGHQTSISYADSFYQSVNRSYPSLQTFAYPTSVTIPDPPATVTSTAQYNYDFGAVTQATDPKGAVVKTLYDVAGRLDRRSRFDGATEKGYTYMVYPEKMDVVQSYSAVKAGVESYTAQVLDGAGRVRATSSYLPPLSDTGTGNYTGNYSGQYFDLDALGRLARQSNPTEMTSTWQPAGDDSPTNGGSGWLYTLQNYDWKGRVLLTTRPKLNPSDPNETPVTVEASYDGCGCAGGEVALTRDEVGRRQKVTYDVLGRPVKTEVLPVQSKSAALDDSGGVYTASVSKYNARDQVTDVKQYAGADPGDDSCPTGTCQEGAMSYDSYGRLSSRHLPAQRDASNNLYSTSYAYYDDDTLHVVTDGRQATTTYTYNNRGLVKTITYGAQDPNQVYVPGAVTYDYDNAGNRVSMTDELGSVSYQYDTLSRLGSETRQFTGVGSFSLTYDYNLADQLTSVTDYQGAQVGYDYDRAGQLKGVTGSGYAGVSNYASSVQHRAWGATKQISYGNGLSLSVLYNTRMMPTTYDVTGASGRVMGWTYNYYDDGRMRSSSDLRDNRLDRSYNYDDPLGRITQGLSGADADGQPATQTNSPYKQTYGYDVWSNLNNRTWRTWANFFGNVVPQTNNYGAQYQNDRNSAWTYDNDGNVVNDGTRTYSYDAAGRLVTDSENIVTQRFNGDGLRARLTENNVTTYYVSSTAMGGQVATEITQQNGVWQKARGYVYAGTEEVAKQEGGQVSWNNVEPSGTSSQLTNASGAVTNRVETDPLGTTVDPSGATTTYNVNPIGYYGNPNNPGAGCAFGSIGQSCNAVARILNDRYSMGWGSGVLQLDVWRQNSLNIPGYGITYYPPFQTHQTYIFATPLFQQQQPVPQPPPTPTPEKSQSFTDAYKACLPELGNNPNAPAPGENQAWVITKIANQTGVDRTLLAATWRFEGGYGNNPPIYGMGYSGIGFVWQPKNGPHGDGTADIGPGQLSPKIWDKAPYTNGLSDPFGSSRKVGELFMGNIMDNLTLTARALMSTSGSRDRQAGLFRAGHDTDTDRKTGKKVPDPNYTNRVNAFNNVAPNYDKFFDCLKAHGF